MKIETSSIRGTVFMHANNEFQVQATYFDEETQMVGIQYLNGIRSAIPYALFLEETDTTTDTGVDTSVSAISETRTNLAGKREIDTSVRGVPCAESVSVSVSGLLSCVDTRAIVDIDAGEITCFGVTRAVNHIDARLYLPHMEISVTRNDDVNAISGTKDMREIAEFFSAVADMFAEMAEEMSEDEDDYHTLGLTDRLAPIGYRYAEGLENYL